MPSRRLKSGWLPTSILLGLVLCWYMLYLIQNTPGRDISPHRVQGSPVHLDDDPDFRIVVLAYDRPESLERLLLSLNVVDYLGDKVTLEIIIDRSSDGTVDNRTVQSARSFKFSKGEKFVYVHREHKGAVKQWIGSWNYKKYPTEICVILEDNLIVSHYLYRWLKSVHKTYDGDSRISGFSLQGAIPVRSFKPINVTEKHSTFLYRVPGSSGFSPSYEQWGMFISWYEKVSADTDFDPKITSNMAGAWYKENAKVGTLKQMWSMWYFYYNWQFNKYVLYPNIQNFQGLAVRKMDPGGARHGPEGKPAPGSLLMSWAPKYDRLSSNPPIVEINGSIIYPVVKTII